MIMITMIVAVRPPVVSTVTVASLNSFSGFPLGESTMLRMRFRTLLMCCVSEVHSHVSMMLRVRVKDRVSNTLNYTEYIDQTRHTVHPYVAHYLTIADNQLTAQLFDNRLNPPTLS